MNLDVRDGVENGTPESVEVLVECGWDAVVDCALVAVVAAPTIV